jgi:predicted amidohydrolase
MRRYNVLSLALILLLIGSGCSSDRTVQPVGGTISVQVIDSPGDIPVEGVEVTIEKLNLVGTTDATGTVVFEVPVGDYFVDARVCCIGPGWIDHHVSVTVTKDETAEVTLLACSICV